jgi:hypothetical protein
LAIGGRFAHAGTTTTQGPQRDRKTFIEEMKREQSIIVAWLQGHYLLSMSFPRSMSMPWLMQGVDAIRSLVSHNENSDAPLGN